MTLPFGLLRLSPGWLLQLPLQGLDVCHPYLQYSPTALSFQALMHIYPDVVRAFSHSSVAGLHRAF